MATINGVIERQPVRSRFPDDALARWLSELDGKLRREVGDTHEGGDGDGAALFVPAPYDGLYDLYLKARSELEAGETENYLNFSEQFNRALTDFREWYHRTRKPKNSPAWRNYR